MLSVHAYIAAASEALPLVRPTDINIEQTFEFRDGSECVQVKARKGAVVALLLMPTLGLKPEWLAPETTAQPRMTLPQFLTINREVGTKSESKESFVKRVEDLLKWAEDTPLHGLLAKSGLDAELIAAHGDHIHERCKIQPQGSEPKLQDLREVFEVELRNLKVKGCSSTSKNAEVVQLAAIHVGFTPLFAQAVVAKAILTATKDLTRSSWQNKSALEAVRVVIA